MMSAQRSILCSIIHIYAEKAPAAVELPAGALPPSCWQTFEIITDTVNVLRSGLIEKREMGERDSERNRAGGGRHRPSSSALLDRRPCMMEEETELLHKFM